MRTDTLLMIKKAGRRFFKMSEFEQTRPGITYVNRKR